MNLWLIRGLILAAVLVLVRAVLGYGIYAWPESGATQRAISVVVVMIAALAWPFFDGYADAKEFEDEEDRADLTLLWLKSAGAAGVMAGFAAWLLSFVIPGIGSGNLIIEVTVGAGFMLLLLSIPAQIGILLGRFFGDRARRRSTEPEPEDEFGRHPIHAHHQKEPILAGSQRSDKHADAQHGDAQHGETQHGQTQHGDAEYAGEYRDSDFAAERATDRDDKR
ncbi:B-4DMT family transporter [Hoyosella sp. G463]|uniref:B-4DMT family transporter n=1 Tax=Lolliginicoccus lacisalsi TaxID=2742202 RepID=A0A927PK45_9ACTN|nr:B-4DMT family transporter [Lolliginicoccus lacisalsi]MBD8505293.1 B-4DMT family transporter [Lolliginicoccus lacisalsi]